MISERDSNSDAVFYEKSVVDLTKRIRSEQSYFPPPIEMLLTKGISLKWTAAGGHVLLIKYLFKNISFQVVETRAFLVNRCM